ncbi:helix-turn-helix domain-containing protein [Litorilituus lipolyticus]|uniref:AraC family transcriptional regulator n=1 Tax=Litorilituus lipolyticus TaxID=2491017 RepID=A0A502L2G3_9GAMM|nr:helix-turn-helix domain-containing protein [Litorilituus lipolyticus]TPH18118.1 AraC family transcriptional regulator [Litorilituus lipolyticus]
MAEFFSQFALAQMVMCALLLFPLRKQNPSISLFILLMLCSCGYLLSALLQPEQDSLVAWLLQITLNALPGVFWLVSLSVFGDHTILQRWQYIVASLTMMVPLSTSIIELTFAISLQDFDAIYGLIKYGMLLLELVLICHALIISFKHWRDDLVQERRYIRGGVIAISGLYIFSVIVLEQLFKVEWAGLEIVTSFLLAALITAINFLLFQLKQSSLFETVKPKASVEANNIELPKQSQELLKVVESMEQDKLYQQDGLTIAGLAKHLSIHEYKLRNLINGELNYRNFNDFLNYYRIKEVTESLASTDYNHLPVLTLALESGFRSLSSFNKAFKNTHGITPTAYRKKNNSNLG